MVWLPPDAYHYLNWWKLKDGKYPKFRWSQLKEYYFERFSESVDLCVGTVRFKKRRDGLTSRRMQRKVWKAIQTKNAWCGMQSKTGKDVTTVCWKTLMAGWKYMPSFYKPTQSGTTDPKTKLEFSEPAARITRSNKIDIIDFDDLDAAILDTVIDWRDTVSDAYDGQELLDLTLDEFAKWIKASILDAIYTYIKCVYRDGEKVGHIHAISSPSEKNNKAHEESLELWNIADYLLNKDIDAPKFFRWFTPATQSYADPRCMDIYGFCDEGRAYDLIMAERAAAPESKKQAVIRQTPITIDEIFSSVDDVIWTNAEEMQKRKIYLIGTKYKDAEQTEPKYLVGNYEWKDGIPDTDVIFRLAPNQEKITDRGRWMIPYQPTSELINKRRVIEGMQRTEWAPTAESENVLGIDPYDYRRTDSKEPSKGAGVMGKCFDFFNDPPLKDIITGLYLYRPKNPHEYYEDMIKWCVHDNAYANAEARNANIIDYFEDRGYFRYLLAKDVKNRKKQDIKGSPTTAPLIQEMCSLIDNHFSPPIAIGEKNNMDFMWLELLLEDVLKLNPDDTKKAHLAMALGQMFLGFSKRRMLNKKRSGVQNSVAEEMAEALRDNLWGL